jgi:hypothetical protein
MESSPLRQPTAAPPIWTCGGLYAATFLAWLAVASDSIPATQPVHAGAMTIIALGVCALSAAARTQVLPAEHPSGGLQLVRPTSLPIAWGLAWMSQVHVLGLLSLTNPEPLAVLPALFLALALELWLFAATTAQPRSQLENEPAADTCEPALLSDDGAWQRRTQDVEDPAGHRAFRGMLRFELAPGQRSLPEVIGFCPAFAGVPEVELECEWETASDEDAEEQFIEAECLQLTPAGARIAIARIGNSGTIRGILHWYAFHTAGETREPDATEPAATHPDFRPGREPELDPAVTPATRSAALATAKLLANHPLP